MGRIDKLRYYVANVLPQAYDESLSYYEVLSKVTYIVNELIEEVSDIESITQEVVESVINEMVASGELADLINPQFQEEVEELNDRVDDLEAEVGRTVNPKFVVFGDSWSAPNIVENEWMDVFARNSRFELLHNYAVNAAGFVAHAPNLIANQVTA